MKIIFFYARVRIILHCAGYAYCATTDILGAFSRINASILPYHTSSEEVMCATCAHIFPINPNTLFTFPFCCLPGISGRNKSLTIDMKIPMLEKGRPPLIKRKNNVLQHQRPGVF